MTTQYEITGEQIEELREAIVESAGGNHGEFTFRTDYSGRKTYGQTCFGVTFERPEVASIVAFELAYTLTGQVDSVDMVREVVIELAQEQAIDSMGYGLIIYWTNVEVV